MQKTEEMSKYVKEAYLIDHSVTIQYLSRQQSSNYIIWCYKFSAEYQMINFDMWYRLKEISGEA